MDDTHQKSEHCSVRSGMTQSILLTDQGGLESMLSNVTMPNEFAPISFTKRVMLMLSRREFYSSVNSGNYFPVIKRNIIVLPSLFILHNNIFSLKSRDNVAY